MDPPSTTLRPGGVASISPSEGKPGRAGCASRSQFAVFKACQIPLRSGRLAGTRCAPTPRLASVASAAAGSTLITVIFDIDPLHPALECQDYLNLMTERATSVDRTNPEGFAAGGIPCCFVY